jgi:FAD/FMN-containing dehydrogenase
MIDVTPMKGIQVDAKRLRARVQCGVLLGELDRAMQAVGLATTLGTVTDTGIAGLTLGGGIGRLMRKYGLTIDNLLSVDVVSADGKLRHASDQENPDLFWAVRGGGGNFGVVTSFEYQLHPFNHKVLSGEKIYPYSQARTVFAAMAELAEGAPDELYVSGGVANFTTGPNLGRYAAFGVDCSNRCANWGLPCLTRLPQSPTSPLREPRAPRTWRFPMKSTNTSRPDSCAPRPRRFLT